MDRIRVLKRCSLILSLILVMAVLISSVPVSAQMLEMADSEMEQVTAGGFSNFSLVNDGTYDIARMQFNMEADTYAEIESMKMAHWDNGGGTGWDQDWTNVDLGSDATDLELKNFVFETKFSNINDPNNRQLEQVIIGFNNVTGTLSADFNSLSRVGFVGRQNVGNTTYHFNNDKMLMIINCTGPDQGIWFDFGNATN